MNKRPLLCVLAGFVLGEVWFYQFHGAAAKAVFSLCVMILMMICIRKKDSFFIFFLTGIIAGGIRGSCWTSWQNDFSGCMYVEDCLIEGRIESEKITDSSITVIVDQLQVNREKYKGKIVLYLPQKVNYYIGCTIKFKGMIEALKKTTNPGEFDYAKYQKGKGIWGCVYEADVLEVRNGSFFIKEGLYRFRSNTVSYLKNNMDESRYGIAAAMLLGEKSELSKEQKSLFERGGISHILAVSGLHMTLIGAGIYKIFRKIGLPYSACVISSFPCILLYAVMTGMSASCWRASWMLLIYLIAQWRGEVYDLLSSLSFAAIWLLWEIPDRVVDSGFLLSFGAMIGLGGILPVLKEMFEYKSGKSRVKDGLFAGIVITLCTLPLSFHFFYGLSLTGLFLNLIVIPLMSVLVPLLASGGIGWVEIFPDVISKICLFLSDTMICLFQWLCTQTIKIPYSYIQTGYRGRGFVILYYFLFAIAITSIYFVDKRRKKPIMLLFFVLLLLLLWFTGRKDSFLTVLDVGQGDGILYHSETGKVCMVDGGSSSKKKIGEYVMEPALKYYGISKVDYWFLSHMDEDHVSGVKELLETGYPIDFLILPDLKEKSEKQIEIEGLAYLNGTKVLYMSRGRMISFKDESILCLHPKKYQSYEDVNQGGLGLLLCVKNQEILLAGDVEKAGEDEMTDYWNHLKKSMDIKKKKEKILKVAHHGSANGTDKKLLNSFCPDIAINSCGKNNLYGHPSYEKVKRIMDSGASFYDTSQLGAIEIKFGDKVKLYHYGME